MAKSIPSFEVINWDFKKLCLHYDIGYKTGPLVILCHVVYATRGFTRRLLHWLCSAPSPILLYNLSHIDPVFITIRLRPTEIDI